MQSPWYWYGTRKVRLPMLNAPPLKTPAAHQAQVGAVISTRMSRKKIESNGEKAEAYYCKRATEIYDSYVNAPRLYKTGADGDKVFLTDEEAEATLSETKDRVSELCG